jgi:uncharacterized protein YbjT (DUF2867 family)
MTLAREVTMSTHKPSLVSALLVGATGLVGHELLMQLLADPAVGEVRALVRRELSVPELLQLPLGAQPDAILGIEKLRIIEVRFDRLADYAPVFAVNWVCCALGSTIKQAGSQAGFRQVDFAYPLEVAQLALAQGATRCLLVSAMGADAGSRVFYNRVKGELEDAIRELGFEHVSVARPSLLDGPRREFRLGERLALALRVLIPEPYKPVGVAQVATGLLACGREGRPGWHELSNTALRAMR